MIPHSVMDYLLALEVEKNGGNVFYITQSFLPWSQCIWQGLKSRNRVVPKGKDDYTLNKEKEQLFNKVEATPGQQLLQEQRQNYSFKRNKILSPNYWLKFLMLVA